MKAGSGYRTSIVGHREERSDAGRSSAAAVGIPPWIASLAMMVIGVLG